MTFEEYCIKFSRRNIKKYGNGSNYSDVSGKKVELLIGAGSFEIKKSKFIR